jgi:hypothetical protein
MNVVIELHESNYYMLQIMNFIKYMSSNATKDRHQKINGEQTKSP